jgi:calcineurin-like phosphoesterase family protein
MAVYACADLHGCRWAWEAIKKVLQPNDTLYFLGDAADRGPDGWAIMNELITDPRVIYIKGNHEDFMLQNIGNSTPDTFDPDAFYWDEHMELWFYNGGEVTYNAFMKDPNRFNNLHLFKNLPFITVYHNIFGETVYLTHAGCNIHDIPGLTEEEAIWNREHYRLNRWDGADNEFVVHGHTPIPLMVQTQDKIAAFWSDEENPIIRTEDMIEPGAYWYAGGHKVNIDCGTVFTGVCVLLNLDTWDEEIFYTNEEFFYDE